MSERGRRKTLIGVVVSNKMDKTAIVAVERRHPHRIYRKIIRTTKRYQVHDANNTAQIGDRVRIIETRPLSRHKRWRIAETMTVGNVADVAPREIGAPEDLLPATESPATPAEAVVSAVETEAAVQAEAALASAGAEEASPATGPAADSETGEEPEEEGSA